MSLLSPSDDQLFILFTKGDEKAFNTLYQRYSSKILNYLFRLIRDFDKAQDLLQETFIRLFKYKEGYNAQNNFSSLIYKVATNLCFNEMKRQKVKKETSLDQMPETTPLNLENKEKLLEENPLFKLEQKERNQMLEKAIDQLSVDHKLVVVLKIFLDLDYAHIAEVLDCPVATLKTRLHYAIKHMEKYILKEGSYAMSVHS